MALTTLARELATLEQERKTLSGELEAAKEKRLADANRAGSAENRAELGKLQDRVRHAAASLHDKTARRDALLDKLERAEQQLASCERSLQALSIEDTPGEAPAARSDVASSHWAQPAEAAAAPKRIDDPAEAAARERVRDLTRELELAKAGQTRARQALVEARNEVQRLQQDAEGMLTPERYAFPVYDAAEREVNEYLVEVGLPAMNDVSAQTDERFSSYLAHFTEPGEGGAVRLKGAFQDPIGSRTAFSALFGAMLPNAESAGLVHHLMERDMSGFAAALRSGREALLPLARIAVVDAIGQIASDAEHIAALTQRAPTGRRRTSIGRQGPTVNRAQGIETGRRNAVLAQVLANPMQRINIITGLADHFASLLDGVTRAHQRALQQVDAAKERLEQVKGEQRPAFQRAVDAERQLNEARDELKQLSADRRQREAAEAKQAAAAKQASAPSTSGTVVPEIAVASTSSTGTDAEARKLKLRGDVLKHSDTIEGLRASIAEADEGVRKAGSDLRAAEDQLDTAAARHARDTENARRERGEQGEELTSLRNRLADLDARIGQAREALRSDPSRKATISDRAWDRAVERHVEPDDASLRARARITGYSGAYPSQAELARSAAEIHAHVSQQPQFQAVMAATSRAEFERAAAAVPGGVTDLVHDHGREVGRVFSNDPDQTSRPTPLTQSNFSLQFVQGRVVVTHIYPYVPHRQLTTA